jgi:hypothetical protein
MRLIESIFKEVDMIDIPNFNKVFDPHAAGLLSSLLSFSKFTSMTPNCGAAKMLCDGPWMGETWSFSCFTL